MDELEITFQALCPTWEDEAIPFSEKERPPLTAQTFLEASIFSPGCIQRKSRDKSYCS